MLGRLRAGATPAQARAELETIGRGLAEAYPTVNSARRLTLVSEDERMRSVFFPALLLMAAVGLVLLISCANVAGLLLARSDSRRREIAVRLALGVSRRRLVRQLLTESALLGSVGAAFGLVIAWWLLQLQPALMPPTPFEVGFDLRLDRSVVVFTCIASAFAVLAFGLVPALQATNVSVVPALKNAERSGGRWMRGLWIRNIFVLGEIALSVVLVTASTLLVRSLLQSQGINLGTDSRKQLVFFDLNPAVAGYDGQRSMELFQTVAENARAVPGVVRAKLRAPRASVGFGRRCGTTRVDSRPVAAAGAAQHPNQVQRGCPRVFRSSWHTVIERPLIHTRGWCLQRQSSARQRDNGASLVGRKGSSWSTFDRRGKGLRDCWHR